MDPNWAACETPADEAELVARLRRREPAAFEILVRTYSPRLLAAAWRLATNEEDARDALQDALLSAFRSIDRFSGESRLGTWLHRIAVNAALMRLRSKRRKPERPIEDFLPQFLEDGHQVRSSTPWPETAVDRLTRQEAAELVRGAIDQLPENFRIVLLLRDIEEIDTEETARLLGTTPGAVKTRLHRARQALRALLDPKFQGDQA